MNLVDAEFLRPLIFYVVCLKSVFESKTVHAGQAELQNVTLILRKQSFVKGFPRKLPYCPFATCP